MGCLLLAEYAIIVWIRLLCICWLKSVHFVAKMWVVLLAENCAVYYTIYNILCKTSKSWMVHIYCVICRHFQSVFQISIVMVQRFQHYFYLFDLSDNSVIYVLTELNYCNSCALPFRILFLLHMCVIISYIFKICWKT